MRSVTTVFNASLLTLFFLWCAASAQEAGRQTLNGHIPDAITALQPMGRLAGTNRLNLAVSLPLRNGDKLSQLLKEITDPASPNFRHYLTPAQFAEQFGPCEADYQAVIAFARAHGLAVTSTHPNRMLLDVSGKVADVEQALHVKMQVYRHPTEARTFYAPDTNPSLELATPVLDVSGLQNYSRPRSRMVARPLVSGQNAQPNAGSGPSGTYMGKDFRAAYVPDTTMTGSGQTVGLLEFDGYTTSDVTHYESLAGLSSVALSNVLLDGFGGQPTGDGGEIEVTLDIEMAISMAPGLSGVIVYEAGPEGSFHDILNRMADDNLAKQMSCSWYDPAVGADPVAEQIFQQMAAQGQSFFAASGDDDAYTGPLPFPEDSPSITQVGGTTLTTSGPGGSWVSETVWNWDDGIGSGGGISTSYAIPYYQTNISMTANQGSTTMRNTPDVALTANNAFIFADGEGLTDYGGTSFAAPLWAGFTALVNQQAVMYGRPMVGFINPALDVIGSGQSYTSCFHDITTGNNTSSASPNKFYAVPGYDLCTGWGVPAGQSLINALATPDPLVIQPNTGFTTVGGSGGPFTVASENFVLTNSGTNTLNWSLVNTSLWLTVSPPGGTLAGGGSDETPTVSLSAGADSLPIGNYTAVVAFSNITSGLAQTRQFTLQVVPSVPPTILTPPASESVAIGSNATFSVSAGGTPPLNYQWQVNTTNINGATNASLTVTNVGFGDAGSYTVTVSNTLGSTNATATLTVGYAPLITSQPQGLEVVQGTNVSFTVVISGTGPFNYQWYFYSVALTQGTNSTLALTNVQAANAGYYSVSVSSPFGSIVSSNAALAIDVFPIILAQPQNQSAVVGSNVTFSVSATGTSPVLPPVSSGTVQLWLRADLGVVTNSAGLVSQWLDQSGNANYASQANTNLQPTLVSASGLSGDWVLRFNGIQNNINGSYLFGSGLVQVPNAMTEFTVYNAFCTTNNENVICDIGIPDVYGANRTTMITAGDMRFSFWNYDYSAPFVVPTNAYRLRTDRLDTNLDTLNMFDATADSATNFTMSVTGGITPGAGYYIGGLNSSIGPYVGSSRNFDGDIAEIIVFSGYLSEPDRLAVANYLEEKYFQAGGGGGGNLDYQWQWNGTNIANATNASLVLSNVQFTNDGIYTVTVSNQFGVTTSSNAALTVGYAPSITVQPQSVEVSQGTNVSFTVGVSGTGPMSYQWYFDNVPLAQATNSILVLANVQAANGGSYDVIVSSPFGSVTSSNATLTVDAFPIVVTQPQSQSAIVGTNVTFSVSATATSSTLPPVGSGTVQLWLRADAGVVTNNAGLVSQWQDQSGNANHASQANTNLQPALVSASGLGGNWVLRFNGIQNNTYGSYLFGSGQVQVPNAMTAFTLYDAFCTTNNENTVWDIGIPDVYGANRVSMITAGDMHFSFWAYDYSAPFIVPTNTYRLRTDRLDTNLDTLNMFDATAASATNFTMSVDGAITPGAGYYIGGLNSSIGPYVGSSRNFDGDIAEIIVYSGYLSEPDRLVVTSYLEGKYFQVGGGNLSYQWQWNGTNIANATNASLVLTNVQFTNDGTYTVVITNVAGSVTSSNAMLTVGYAPSITAQPQSVEVAQGTNVSFTVGASGTGPMSYQWYFDGAALAQDTNSTLALTNIQAANIGSYNVVVSSPFGSIASSTATLTVDAFPVIMTQPQSQSAVVGTNVTFSVLATATATSPTLPSVSSGTVQLWLKADAGVVTNSGGFVSQWQDQSGNANHASQANTNLQPTLVSASGLGGNWVLRFNGIQNNTYGSYLFGSGQVQVPNALTAFTLYNAFCTTNNENTMWDIGIPNSHGANRVSMITAGDMRFSFWSYDYSAPFIVPTNTYRLRTDRLNTNLNTLNMFDTTAGSATNFTMSVTGALTPGAGYYVGGLNSSAAPGVGSSRNFDGDIAEIIVYSGYLSETDRLAVAGYLEQKYFGIGASGSLSYQWQWNGTNIANATNASLTLSNVQFTNDGIYTVTVSNQVGVTTSSNAVLTVGGPPRIIQQPASQSVELNCSATFTVSAMSAAPLSYQWWNNGVTLGGQTNSSLTIASVQASNVGSYSVTVSSVLGATNSKTAMLALAQPPVANPVTVQRFIEGGVRLNVLDLITNDTVAVYDALTVIAVSSNSAAGGTVSLNAPWIYYAPPPGLGVPDTFAYLVSDGHCGTAVGTVTVQVQADNPQPLHFIIGRMGDGSLQMTFDGIPNQTYGIDYSDSLSPPNWQVLTNQTADGFGAIWVTDWPLTNVPTRYYRAVGPNAVPLHPQ